MILDIITCLLVAFGFYQGFSKGLIKTVFASFSLLIGIVAALKLFQTPVNLLESTFNLSQPIAFVLGFVLTFIVTMALIRFIGGRVEALMKAINIGGLNKLAGGILLGAFYGLLVSYAVYFVDKVELLSDEVKSASFTYPIIEPLPRASQEIGEGLKPLFSEFWDQLMITMDSLKEKGEELTPEG